MKSKTTPLKIKKPPSPQPFSLLPERFEHRDWELGPRYRRLLLLVVGVLEVSDTGHDIHVLGADEDGGVSLVDGPSDKKYNRQWSGEVGFEEVGRVWLSTDGLQILLVRRSFGV